jgi:secondary thiamine-phosphate synthase enzyme
MASDSWITEAEPLAPAAGVRHLRLRSRKRIEFLDVTEAVVDAVRQAQVGQGLVSVQTLHTTTAIVVNENEPGLLEDMVGVLEKLAPRGPAYQHDDLSRRPGVPPDEPANGDAHCKAMLLPA